MNPLSTDPDAVPKPDLEQFRQLVQKPIRLVPEKSLHLLLESVRENSGGSQAARSFLYWLAGEPDPTGFKGQGALELRRMDASLQKAALEVFEWWIGPTASDEPLWRVLRVLRDKNIKESQPKCALL